MSDGVTELTGGAVDEDCLHCHLPPLLDQWMQQHPQVVRAQVLIQLAQALGELVGSSAPDAACADRLCLGLLQPLRQSARQIALAGPKGPPS